VVFAVPDPATWPGGFQAVVAGAAGLDGYRDLERAAELADRFITPLLGDAAPGRWCPAATAWN